MAKLLDIFACKECDRAIFLNLEDRAADHFVCPHCQHDQSRAEAMESYEAELASQKEDTKEPNEPPPNYPDVLACPSCDQAIKLNIDEQGREGLNCPNCSAALPASNVSPDQKQPKNEGSNPVDDGDSLDLDSGATNDDAPSKQKASDTIPELLSCEACDRALFVTEESRQTGMVDCEHCGHHHGKESLNLIASAQLVQVGEVVSEAQENEPAFPELIECPDCQRAIKLLPEQREADSTTCPYCKTSISAPEPVPVEEEVVGQVAKEKVTPHTETEEESLDSTLFEDEPGNESDLTSIDGAQAVDETDTRLLENMIESSRNQSLMPECFQCPKCETEIVLPEAERMMGLCFCPECEELIDSNTAQAKVSEKPESDDEESALESETVAKVKEEGEGSEIEVEEPVEQDVGVAMDDAASEMEFWIDEVLPEVVDCVKCGNSLKLDDEEKMFGIYRCPYCKANINHAKGEVVQSILGVMEEGGEDEEDVSKRKPIKVDFKALRPYAALLIFSVSLIYGVSKITDYFLERESYKASLISKIEGMNDEMKERKKVYNPLLTNEINHAKLNKPHSLSIAELEEFEREINDGRKKVYDDWFKKEGDIIAGLANSDDDRSELVSDFQKQMKQFNVWVKLASMDSGNLSTAMGLSKFEKDEGLRMIKEHIEYIKRLLNGIRDHAAIKKGLVGPRVVTNLISAKLKMERFDLKTAREAVRQFELIEIETYELAVFFPVGGDAVSTLSGQEYKPGNLLKTGTTPWNGELKHWQEAMDIRDQENAMNDWGEVVSGFQNLKESLGNFNRELKNAVNSPPEAFSKFNHEFLNGGAFRTKLTVFQNLNGVRKFVSPKMMSRLEHLARELNPNITGSLSHRIRVRQSSSLEMTKTELEKFYEDFNRMWQPFVVDQQWFDTKGLSSFYHLAKPGVTMISRPVTPNE